MISEADSLREALRELGLKVLDSKGSIAKKAKPLDVKRYTMLKKRYTFLAVQQHQTEREHRSSIAHSRLASLGWKVGDEAYSSMWNCKGIIKVDLDGYIHLHPNDPHYSQIPILLYLSELENLQKVGSNNDKV